MTDQASLASGVALRYASALYDLATEAGAVAGVEADLDKMTALLDESADLRRLTSSPVFSAEDQVKAMTAVLDAAGIGGWAGNFVKLAARNRRLFVLPDMIKAFKALASAGRGEVPAEVVSAEALSDAVVANLKTALSEATAKTVTLSTRVDPALIGGLIVKVGSKMIDTSLKTRLTKLETAMKEVG